MSSYASELEPESELLTINLGPHHPATHGVLRLLCTLEGEIVREMKPVIGYVHTGIEKSCEDQAYWKVIPFVERMDYLAYYFNAMAYCSSVEKLVGIDVPPRAQYLRVIHMELNRIASHLFWLATSALDLGAVTFLWWGIRERDYVLEYPIHADYALIKADRADRWGNLAYRKTARNFAPLMAMAATCTVVQVRETVELGALDPEMVVTPGIFVQRIIKIAPSLRKAA